jgi:hypothetical protein
MQQQQRIPTRSSEREIQWRISRNNFHHSTTGHLLFPRNPRDIAAHDPGTVADRLHVDHALPAKASRVLHVLIWIDEGGEDRRSQLEHALEGWVQVDVGRCVGGVRFQLEQRVGRLFRNVDYQRRVGRARVDDEAGFRFAPGRGEQGEVGDEDAGRVGVK